MTSETYDNLPAPTEDDITDFKRICASFCKNFKGFTEDDKATYARLSSYWVMLYNAKEDKKVLTVNQKRFLMAKDESKVVREIRFMGFPKRKKPKA